MNIEIRLLKVYQYRGVRIYIRQIGNDIYEFFIIFRGNLYSQAFFITDREKIKLEKRKETGGAAFLVCQSAESNVDALIKKYSLWYNVFWKHFDLKRLKEIESQKKIKKNNGIKKS